MADLTQIQFNGVTYNLIDDTALHPSDVDTALSDTSENPVQNAVVTNKINTMPQQGVYYLVDDGSIAADTTKPYYASRWITTNDNISSYFDGLTVAVKVPVAGNGTYGTVLSVNGLGEHPVIRNVSTMIGTTYGVGSMLVLTYDATATATAYINSNAASTITGVWKLSDYDSTIVYRLQQYYTTPRVNAGAGTLYRYEICFSKFDGSLVPANNQSNKATTYNKVLNDEPFDPFGNIYYYLSTTAVEAGDPVAANTLYRVYLGDIRYSFNINSGGTAGTTALTSHEPIYIKALYNKTTKMATLTQDLTSANYLERSGLVQDLPSTNPNTGLASNQMYIYIYLGHAYNKYQIDLACLHQVYAWDSNSQSATIFFGESGTSGGTTDPNAFHKTDIIPIANGGTGIDGGSVETWYYNHNLHPHFAIFYDPLNVRYTVFWMGPLDGISSVSDFLASDYFKYAQKITHPMYLFNTSGSYLGSAMLFTGAFDSSMDTTKIYLLFPDAVSFNGTYVNGLGGNLVYDSSDGIYMNPATMTPSVPKWATEIYDINDALGNKEDISNLVTSVDSSSTDDQYPSAKLLYDTKNTLSGLIEDVDEAIPSKVDYSNTPFVGTCSTAAATMAKTVTVDSSFQLVDGVRVRVYMEKANTNSAPTLNVNGTGAKSIGIQNPYGAISNVALSAWHSGAFARNGWFDFVYAASYDSGAGRWIIEDSPAPIRLANFAASRLSTINSTNGTLVNGGVRYSVVGNGATGNPFSGSAAVLWLSHDNTATYTRQIAMSANTPPHMAFRSQTSDGGTGWQDWEYVLTAANQYDSHMATLAYTAAGIDFTTGAVTIPINGTQYKLIQLTIFNNDISKALGYPSLFLFNASGSTGYKEGTSTYCTASSTSSSISVTFDSSWNMIGSTSIDITALYRRIS